MEPKRSYRDSDVAAKLAGNRRQEIVLRHQLLDEESAYFRPTGYESRDGLKVLEALRYVRSKRYPTLRPLLPKLFQLQGKPYSIEDYFAFEPAFRTLRPRQMLFKTARQCGKSTMLAASLITLAASIPHFSIVTVTPLYEMVRRFSHNYVGQFINTSPYARLLVDKTCLKSVLQRSLRNHSNLYFTYALLDAERTRGIPGSMAVLDELQNFNINLLPVIYEVLGNSDWGWKLNAGTPKSLENPIEITWLDSSQAEWVVKCREGDQGCNYWNMMTVGADLLAMIGMKRTDLSEKAPGVVCAKCRKPLNPRHGHWHHQFPERRLDFPGYHIPRPLMPKHYTDDANWSELVGKMQGKGNTTQVTFFNEVLGESSDAGTRLVSQTDLKAAAVLPWRRESNEAVKHINKYPRRFLSIDWGGGGGQLPGQKSEGGEKQTRRLRTSYTVYSIIGWKPDGTIDVIWAHRSTRTHNHEYEAHLAVQIFKRFKCSHIVHDFSGAGSVRETLMRRYGVPFASLIPVTYHRPTFKDIVTRHLRTVDNPREFFSVDKSFGLGFVCEAIKAGKIHFFEYDHLSSADPGLLHDFLALIEEKLERHMAPEAYIISRNINMPDDFAQTVCIGACLMWYWTKSWPDLAAAWRFKMDQDVEEGEEISERIDWSLI